MQYTNFRAFVIFVIKYRVSIKKKTNNFCYPKIIQIRLRFIIDLNIIFLKPFRKQRKLTTNIKERVKYPLQQQTRKKKQSKVMLKSQR